MDYQFFTDFLKSGDLYNFFDNSVKIKSKDHGKRTIKRVKKRNTIQKNYDFPALLKTTDFKEFLKNTIDDELGIMEVDFIEEYNDRQEKLETKSEEFAKQLDGLEAQVDILNEYYDKQMQDDASNLGSAAAAKSTVVAPAPAPVAAAKPPAPAFVPAAAPKSTVAVTAIVPVTAPALVAAAAAAQSPASAAAKISNPTPAPKTATHPERTTRSSKSPSAINWSIIKSNGQGLLYVGRGFLRNPLNWPDNQPLMAFSKWATFKNKEDQEFLSKAVNPNKDTGDMKISSAKFDILTDEDKLRILELGFNFNPYNELTPDGIKKANLPEKTLLGVE